MNLTELATKHKADKVTHGFTKIYDKYFSAMRNDIKKVLEIGIGHQYSLKMWREYFPNANIYGIDNEMWGEKSNRINLFNADQNSRIELKKFVDQFKTTFDIIIDDGGHFHHQQQISIGFLFEYLKSEGIYIIEDLHTSFIDEFGLPAGDDNTTYTILDVFNKSGIFESIYLTKNENEYLQKNIEFCKLYDCFEDMKSITSVIKKK